MFAGFFFFLKFSFYFAPLEYRMYFGAKILTEVAQLKVSSNRNSKKNRGFYIALGVCLIAVGAAAWTTYDSVTKYTEPQSSAESKAAETNDTVSGIFVNDVSSAPTSSAKPVSSSPASSSAAPAVSSKTGTEPTAAAANTFTMPVSGKVSQAFSKKPVFNKTLGDYRAHTGVDLSAKTGETVKACADGVVTKVANDDRNGNTIVIKHGSIEATYCGLDKMLVKEKQTVKRGQKIGTVGVDPTESLESPHLHLIMKQNGQYIDPMTILK
jgi:murein DD-endopeptidase MepM/ murein hydrolase activator NlpD